MLDTDRINKINRVRFDKDKRLSLGAGVLLRYALKEEGIDNFPTVSEKKNGKPFFADYPQLHFNLSHSGSYAMCALSETEVGCDIQAEEETNLRIAERFFSEEEKHWLFSLPEEGRINAFCRIWALKESFIKTTGDGLRLPLEEFSVLPGEKIEFLCPPGYAGREYSFFEKTDIPGYSCACCVEGRINSEDFNLISVRLEDIINRKN